MGLTQVLFKPQKAIEGCKNAVPGQQNCIWGLWFEVAKACEPQTDLQSFMENTFAQLRR